MAKMSRLSYADYKGGVWIFLAGNPAFEAKQSLYLGLKMRPLEFVS